MPVWVLNDEIAYELSDDPRHTPLDGNSKDIILADVIPLPTIDTTGIRVIGLASFGDFILYLGWIIAMLAEIGMVLSLPVYLVRFVTAIWSYRTLVNFSK